MKMTFTKMHGLGNDFIVIDAVSQKIALTPEIIGKLADRHRGIGFDQILLIENPKQNNVDFFYRIFNRDGSESAQCGNGARCIAKFVVDKNLIAKKNIMVETRSNIHELILEENGLVSVNMQAPEFELEKIPFIATTIAKQYLLESEVGEFEISALSMGNPHCVLELLNHQAIDINKVGYQLSHHPRFPQQTNVEFMQIISPEEINVRTYERGVGETQACGSGACAAVVAGRLQNKLAEKVKVQMPGGTLEVSWKGDNEPVWMTGEAVYVFEGVVDLTTI